MLVFWIAVSILVAVALALVLPALMVNLPPPGPSRTAVNLVIYRDRRRELEAEHAAGHIDDGYLATALVEMDRELLRNSDEGALAQTGTVTARSPYSAILIAVLLPLVAFGVYLLMGTPEALLITQAGPRVQPDGAAAGAQTEGVQHSAQEMVVRLEQRLRDAPEDAEGWLMLGRSYGAMNRLQDAREALTQASRKRPDHPLTLVSLAEVMARLQGDRLDGEPIALVERALLIEPNFPRGLWLAGMHALDRGDPDRARILWQRLLLVPGLGPQATSRVREAIARAAGPAGAAPTAGSSADQKIIATVTLSPELVAHLEGSETLFVFAQASGGPPMPLAVARRRADELPLTVILDDSMAMTPQMRLSSFQQVVVSARVSRSGSATVSPGDLLGRSAPVSPGTNTAVGVLIDRVVN